MCGFSKEELEKHFHYDPWTGEFGWIDPDKECFLWNTGYLGVSYCGSSWLVHRLIFILMTGDFPLDNVDHINRVKLDNRWENLRDVPQKLNTRNLNMNKHNKTGVSGVYWDKDREKYRAQISLDNKTKYLGLFDSLDEAKRVRQEAETANGFINSNTIEE